MSTPPSLYCADEFIVDNLTCNGISPLSFTGLLIEPSPSLLCIVSARLIKSQKLVLAHTLCEQAAMLDSFLQFLRARGIYWHSMFELWKWAVAHHWPHPDTLSIDSQMWRRESEFRSSETPVSNDEGSIRHAITEKDAYVFDYCFSINQLVVAWDPKSTRFRFPKIDDYLTLQACIKLLGGCGAAFLANNALESQQLFESLRKLAALRGWPLIGECLERIAFWEQARSQVGN